MDDRTLQTASTPEASLDRLEAPGLDAPDATPRTEGTAGRQSSSVDASGNAGADQARAEEQLLEEVDGMLTAAIRETDAITASALSGSETPSNAHVDDVLADLFGPTDGENAAENQTSADSQSNSSSAPIVTRDGEADAASDPAAATMVAVPTAARAVAEETSAPTNAAVAPSVTASSVAESPASPVAPIAPANTASAAAPKASADSDTTPRKGILLRLVDRTLLPPLRTISAPVGRLSPGLRTVVGLLGLTLLPWVPAMWWLGGHVAAADRVRPLNTEEMAALTALSQSGHAGGTDAGHGKGHGDAKKAPEHEGGTKAKAESGHAKPEDHKAEKKPESHGAPAKEHGAAEKKPEKKPEKKAEH